MTTYHLSIHQRYTPPQEESGPFAPIRSHLDSYSWHRTIQLNDREDFEQAQQLCQDTKNMAGFWKQIFLSIRPDNAMDLLLPTYTNYVQKVSSLAKEAIVRIGAIFLDLITLPIRLITFIPRAIYCALVTQGEHPLIPYLRGKGLTAGETDGRAYIEVYKEEVTRRAEANGGMRTVHTNERKTGDSYTLYLADREFPFPMYETGSISTEHSDSTTHGFRELG